MTGYYLPLSLDPWQVFTVNVQIDGTALQAQIEIRYLPAPDQWVISIWDHSNGELLVNMIPLICSYGTDRAWDLFSVFVVRMILPHRIRAKTT